MLVFPELDPTARLPVKGGGYSLATLLADASLAKAYRGGSVVVLRLAPPDYHRFHFPCAGEIGPARAIAGLYDSVNPYALARKPDLFCHNQRELSMLSSPLFGTIAFLEVGAMCVGTIVQTCSPGPVSCGQEKGYFQFGGSTVLLCLEPGQVCFDQDLVDNSANGLETKLRCGSPLGRANQHTARSS